MYLLYHLTCMALCAIYIEKHKKKGSAWGPYALKWSVWKNMYGPTGNVYDSTRNSLSKMDAS